MGRDVCNKQSNPTPLSSPDPVNNYRCQTENSSSVIKYICDIRLVYARKHFIFLHQYMRYILVLLISSIKDIPIEP